MLTYDIIPVGDWSSGTIRVELVTRQIHGYKSRVATAVVLPGDSADAIKASFGPTPHLDCVVDALVQECGDGTSYLGTDGMPGFRRRMAVITFESLLREFQDGDLDVADALEAVQRVMAVERVLKS